MDHKFSNGSALLSALFLMTLVAIAATAMSIRLQADIHQAQLSIQTDKILLASEVVNFWAMDTLTHPKLNLSVLDNEGKILIFPHSLSKIYPGMIISGGLYDLQARFNLNNLQNGNFRPLFIRLLQNVAGKVDLKTLEYIADATINWVSPYQPARGMDNFLTYYSKQSPPYLPSYQPMHSVTEFRLVAGVSGALYRSVKSMITALPSSTPININTASPQVIKILGNGLTDAQVKEIIELREDRGPLEYKDILLLLTKYQLRSEQITVQSDYYLSVGVVVSGDLKITHYVLLQRTRDRSGSYTAHVLSETLNSY